MEKKREITLSQRLAGSVGGSVPSKIWISAKLPLLVLRDANLPKKISNMCTVTILQV